MKKLASALLAITALVIGFTPSFSSAVSCVVDVPPAGATSGDASLQNSTSCGLGASNANHPTSTALQGFTGISGWSEIDRDEGPSSDGELLYSGSKSGWWAVDDVLTAYDYLAIILKDGAGLPDNTKYVWFLLDMTASCAVTGIDLCGSWKMYLEKDISYMSLWGVAGNPNTQVPEPSTLLLLGAGLIVMSRFARKLK